MKCKLCDFVSYGDMGVNKKEYAEQILEAHLYYVHGVKPK